MAKLDGFGAFQLFRALKLHFTSEKYDFHQYSGRSGSKIQYEKGGKYFFDKIARKYTDTELEWVFVSNLLQNPNVWIKDIVDDKGVHIYNKWCLRNHSLSERFKNDLTTIVKICNTESIKYNDIFVSPNRDHPLIIKMVMDETIDIETFVILDDIMKITPFLNRDLQGDPIWDTLRFKIWKYRGFVRYDIDKMKHMVKTTLR